MQNKLDMKDHNAIFWHKIDVLCTLISQWYYTLIMRARCRVRHVNLGSNCKFYGKSLVQRAVNSTIFIGADCQFRSKSTSNKIGINHPCMITAYLPNSKVLIGNKCGFSGVTIRAAYSIVIGNNVRVGANSVIYDSDGHQDDKRTSGVKPIVIEDNVWIGYGVFVTKGVTIGKNSIIGAYSIVTKDIPANVIAAGNPCRVIKSLNIN